MPRGGTGRPPVPTEREQARGSGGGGPVDPPTGGYNPIPEPLSERYRYVETVGFGSSEAELFRIEAVDDPRPLVLKLYRQGIELKEQALETLSGLSTDHVVALVEFGHIQRLGRWYEVQEFLEAGDLVDFVESVGEPSANGSRIVDRVVFDQIVLELVTALDEMHRAGLAHHDVKPQNVLVRDEEALDLVMADFGLAAVASRNQVLASRRDATPAYMAPEVLYLRGGSARDYWGLGMTLARVAGGREPFADLSEHAILVHLENRLPIDLDHVEDEQVRHLCAGLTRYDTDDRWGRAEVERWLAGDPPDLVAERSADPVGSNRAVRFGGRSYTTSTELAGAMALGWSDAARQLAGATSRRRLVEELSRAGLLSEGVAAVFDDYTEDRRPDPDRQLLQLVLALDPSMEPLHLGGFSIEAGDLAGLASEALGGDDDAQRIVALLFEKQVLPLAGRIGSNRPRLVDVGEEWRTQVRSFEAALDRARAAGAVVPAVDVLARARLLRAVTDEDSAASLERESTTTAASRRDGPRWFEDLARETGAGSRLALVALRDEADRVARETRIREQAARDQERREAATELAAARSRRWGRDRSSVVHLVVVLVTAVVPVALGALVVVGLTRGGALPFVEVDPEVWWPTAFEAIELWPAAKALWILGAGVVTAFYGLVLVGRRHPRERPAGMAVGAVLLVLAAGIGVSRDGIIQEAADSAAVTRATNPIPTSAIPSLCRNAGVWTGTVTPVRTVVVGPNCNVVRQYSGRTVVWEAPLLVSVDQLVGVGPVYVAETDVAVVAIDKSSGQGLWAEACPTPPSVDTTLADAGPDTPPGQLVQWTCQGVLISADPLTGQHV